MTPHNQASRGDYAQAVLLPGDPLRAAWMAENFLDDARQVNALRGCLGFTGTYKGVPLSIQATGMGSASLAIYAHELLDAYRARILIRTGTCGGLSDKLPLRSLVLSQAASTDSAVNRQMFWPFDYAPAADFQLLRGAADIARNLGMQHTVGPTVSSEIFYHPDPSARYQTVRQHGALAVDMETAALYTVVARFGAKALSICTVVDNLVTGEETAENERHELFREMTLLAAETAVAASAEA
ncbi:MAG: purine-nucleoside phosphorylase [Rhizobiaceae bacterium]|nr:purine-nucleoside phosphorylase [Rhizobiaceae bacterium]